MLELCVIFGGQSPEHEISRKSVTSVLNNLNKDKYNISTIGITKNGAWYLYTGDYAKIESGEWEQDTENKKKAILSPIQGLFELSGIPYVGMGVMASANGMDKTSSKIVFASADIPQADWVVVNKTDNFEDKMDEIENKLGYPCFVKPARTGSSVGVGKAHDRKELKAALENAAQFDRKILVEENIDGHEVECAVLGNEDVKAATVGEIMLNRTSNSCRSA